ncbi:type III secretion system export apparatus subunit SctT [Peristeroidobacter soli]|uniref:type III secretion system export apparatus subunit SctT n=1 Tax=Peristeroidobacter soli TaxID=2497877 RepID=UPI00101BC4A6|nr:type III secretion system export apparatus subunit SctT [Peristeroidobacter soli]
MEATQFLGDFHRVLIALMCVTVRIQVAFAIIPLFNKQMMPALLRSGIAIGLSLLLLPPVLADFSTIPEAPRLIAIVVKEGVLGLLIGYCVAALFWAVEAVGFFIDNQRGASIASTLDPLTGNDSSPLGILFNQAFVVYFMVAGGFSVLMTLLYASYGLWPVLTYFPSLPPDGLIVFADVFGRIVRLAVLLSAPVIVAMMLAEMGLALMSRFVPQLQVFFLAMPVKCGMAFFVLVVYLPVLFGYLREEIGVLPELLQSLAGAFG